MFKIIILDYNKKEVYLYKYDHEPKDLDLAVELLGHDLKACEYMVTAESNIFYE